MSMFKNAANEINRPKAVSKRKGIITTPPFTAYIANNFGQGRVGRHSIARGRTAIVPDGFDQEQPEQFRSAREPVSRSIAPDSAGIFSQAMLRKP